MPSKNDLLTEINKAFGLSIIPGLTTASDISDIFEAYILSLILSAAHIEGGTIAYFDVYQMIPAQFIYRTSPGYIFSKNKKYCYAEITFPGKEPLEVHNGLRVIGKSGVLHECDVSVIEQSEANFCRTHNISPRSYKVIIAVECKFYSTTLQLHLAREFLGLPPILATSPCPSSAMSSAGSSSSSSSACPVC